MAAFHFKTWILVLAATLLIQLSVNVPGKASEDGLSSWVPVTHVEDVNKILGSQLQPGPATTAALIWGVNQQMKVQPLSLPFTIPFK